MEVLYLTHDYAPTISTSLGRAISRIASFQLYLVYGKALSGLVYARLIALSACRNVLDWLYAPSACSFTPATARERRCRYAHLWQLRFSIILFSYCPTHFFYYAAWKDGTPRVTRIVDCVSANWIIQFFLSFFFFCGGGVAFLFTALALGIRLLESLALHPHCSCKE